ncbi:autoinducer binding domain-containing protein [uncultured Cohaesibacter sp.]|uniref:autoinducer binding domain-containing protein n=1 Tax=uncultured Cohaesibacter sp. TaxID=1002546 RepID=UPI002AA92C07|nr:autoinducer binding domain-containing protein [uncultured Cohaesibacter sp.]
MSASRMTKWEDLARTKKEIDFLKVAENCGLKHGFSIPRTGPNGGAYVLSLAGYEKTTDDQMKEGMIADTLLKPDLLAQSIACSLPASTILSLMTNKSRSFVPWLKVGLQTKSLINWV